MNDQTQMVQAQPAPLAAAPATTRPFLAIQAVVDRVNAIKEIQRKLFKPGVHYDKIGKPPRAGEPDKRKNMLLKPGAELIRLAFQLASRYEIHTTELGDGHREHRVRCILEHKPTGEMWGEGWGSCSTMEPKYRYRHSGRSCPICKQEGSIIKGKSEYGGGWICWKAKDGCGEKFGDNDPKIIGQSTDKVENSDIAELYNTVLKMAVKRADNAATISSTACSDQFESGDMEDADVQPTTVAPAPQQQTQQRPATTNAVQTEDGTWIDPETGEMVPAPGDPVPHQTTAAPQQQPQKAGSKRGSDPEQWPGNYVINFGKQWKGYKLSAVATDYISYMIPLFEESINDPERAHQLEANKAKHNAFTSELAIREGREGTPGEEPAPEPAADPQREAMGVPQGSEPW